MKKYCLTDIAKQDVKEVFLIVSTAVGIVMASFLFAWMLVFWAFIIGLEANADIAVYVGFLGNVILLPIGVIAFKRWLQKSIVEC